MSSIPGQGTKIPQVLGQLSLHTTTAESMQQRPSAAQSKSKIRTIAQKLFRVKLPPIHPPSKALRPLSEPFEKVYHRQRHPNGAWAPLGRAALDTRLCEAGQRRGEVCPAVRAHLREQPRGLRARR